MAAAWTANALCLNSSNKSTFNVSPRWMTISALLVLPTCAPHKNRFPWSLTTRTITVMAKPLRCRLRLHKWEYRENSETHEYYQVCLRCNAYRDKGSSAFDGRGAWGIGG